MTLLAWVAAVGRFGPPLGVLAGGALVGISYRGIKDGIDAVSARAGDDRGGHEVKGGRRRRARGLVKFFTRYAILTAAAYVIIGRLALPPVAVIAGASSLVVAVAVEAARYRFGANGRRTSVAGKL
jgi:hypothetical protein